MAVASYVCQYLHSVVKDSVTIQGSVVRKVDSAIYRIVVFFKLPKVVHILEKLRLKYTIFKLKFRFINREFDICKFV